MFSVAIDGPSGAGKSSISREVAEELNFIYVDTGALYRAIGLYLVENGISPGDSGAVCAALQEIQVDIRHTAEGQRVFLCKRDVTDSIRSPEVSNAASEASVIPEVRSFLMDIQTDIAAKNDVVMDGRDIGTVVLPNANVKIFLTAAPEERARRRCLQMESSGMETDYNTVLGDILMRDDRDSNRKIAPLKPAPGAITVDSTANERWETVRIITDIIKKELEKS